MPKKHSSSSFSFGVMNLSGFNSLSRLLDPKMHHYMAVESVLYSNQNKGKVGYKEVSDILRECFLEQLPDVVPEGIRIKNFGVRVSLLLRRGEAEKDVDNVAKWVIDVLSEAINFKYTIHFDDSQIDELVILKNRDSILGKGSRAGSPPEIKSIIGVALGYAQKVFTKTPILKLTHLQS